MSVIETDPIWVADRAELEILCQRWQQQGAIAIDTEFMRSSTFYPKTALFQVGDGQGCYLIDPLAIEDFSAFKALMLDETVTKVLHSCSEDLEVFRVFLGVIPKPLFDTQLAAALVGYGFSLGYARLVEAMLGIDVPKGETRSDWLRRPLSQSQLQYAALDVGYLIVIYGILLKELKAQGRLDWVMDDCAGIVRLGEESENFSQFYLKVKLAWKLKRPELAVLQALAAWRESESRQRNVPRNHLIKEKALWDMAHLQPTALSQLHGLEGMTARMIKADGTVLLSIIAEAQKTPESQCPSRLPAPLPPSQGDLLKALKRKVRETAENLNVAPELLVRKKDFEALIRSGMGNQGYSLGARLQGWRRVVVGDDLLCLVEGWAGNR